LPAFATLLGAGRVDRHPSADGAAALAARLGLAAPLPFAALRRLALRDDAGDHEWLCLDPVRLDFAERSVVVGDPVRLALSAAEAEALAVSLAPTFAGLGRLEAIAPPHWTLRLDRPAPPFTPLPEAIGRSASPLPPGDAHAPWRRALSEAQMILHAHPVNREREALGRPLVNSLWPWGGGRLPTAVATSLAAIHGDAPAVAGLARLLGLSGSERPERFGPATDRATLVMHAALELPAQSGDALAWREEASRLEAGWLAPALDALRHGGLDGLVLVAPGEQASFELRVAPRDLWKFWRRPQSLAAAFGIGAAA
jgi:hypothetical protein